MTARFHSHSSASVSCCASYAVAGTSAHLSPILDIAMNLAMSIFIMISIIISLINLLGTIT